MPDEASRLRFDSLVDESEQVASGITYGQGAVGGRRQFPSRGDDPVQRRVEIEAGTDFDEDMQQSLHLIARRQQLVELRVHPANQPTLAQSSKSRTAFVAGHPTQYLQDAFSQGQLARRQHAERPKTPPPSLAPTGRAPKANALTSGWRGGVRKVLLA